MLYTEDVVSPVRHHPETLLLAMVLRWAQRIPGTWITLSLLPLVAGMVLKGWICSRWSPCRPSYTWYTVYHTAPNGMVLTGQHHGIHGVHNPCDPHIDGMESSWHGHKEVLLVTSSPPEPPNQGFQGS